MPFIEDSGAAPARLPTFAPPPNPLRPSFSDTVAAGFLKSNPTVNVFRSQLEQAFPPDAEGHDPLDVIRGTKFQERYLDRFIESRSKAETQSIIGKIESEEQTDRTLKAAGWGGTLASIAGGTLDPTIALPAGQIYRNAKGGYALIRSGISTGVAAGGQMAVQEAILQGTQSTRSTLESTTSIGSGILLAGFIGTGAASLLSRAERGVLTRSIDHTRAEIDAHARGEPPPEPPRLEPATDRTAAIGRPEPTTPEQMAEIRARLDESSAQVPTAAVQPEPALGGAAAEEGSSLPQSGGAAAADSRRLEMVPYGLAWTSRGAPTRYVVESSSITARRDMADLASMPYRFKDNIPVGGGAPVATTQGPPLDILAGMAIKGTGVKISDELGRLYGQYRFGDPEATAPRLRGNLDRVLGRDEGLMTYTEFKKEVSRAMITGDRHAIPEVAQGAQTVRQVFDTWLKRAQEAKILPEDIDVKTAESYLHRVYNKEAIRANEPGFVKKITDWLQADQDTKYGIQVRVFDLIKQRNKVSEAIEKATSETEIAAARAQHTAIQTKIEKEIAGWEGTTVKSAQNTIRKAYEAAEDKAIKEAEKLGVGVEKPKVSRTQKLNDAIDRAVEKILNSDRGLSPEDLQFKAQEIKDRVLGTPDGRLPYDIDSGGSEIGWRPKSGGEQPRGPLAKREFNIPDKAIWDYLEQDIEKIAATHLRTVVPDVLLTEKFGDTRMTESLKNILNDYNERIAATKSQKGQAALVAEREGVMERMVGVRDRLRGVYGWSANSENMGRIANAAKMFNNITTGGMFAVASLADFAGAIFRHGFSSAMADGWAPYLRGLMNLDEGAFKEFKAELRAIGIGIDVTTNARQHSIDDVLDTYRPQSKFERTLAWMNDKTFIANFLSPLTDMQKQIAAHAVASNILRYVKAASEGKATSEQLTKLAEANIDVGMAGRIWRQFDELKHGEVRNGVHLPNTADWTDKAARDAFNGAMYRDVDIAVVTPGQEKPLFLSTVGGSILGQFKTFTAASTERILIANLQRRDAQVLQGLVAAMALGAMSYKINGMLGGVKTSDRPQDWIKESVSRSGVTGWLEEGNALASKMTRGGVDMYRMLGADHPLSRYASRSTLDQLLGPTAGKVESLSQVTGALGSKLTNRTDSDWTESDTKAVRRLTVWNNMIWLRGAINQLETGINGKLGIEAKH